VVQETVSGSGTLQPANQVDVNFASGGTLERVAVKAGDHVRKGEVLATIDGRDADIELQKAAASLDAAQTNLTEVEDAYDADASSATAAPSNGSTGATTTAADVASAKADLAGAQATYDAAVKGVADTTLKAPITGTVASVSNVAGEIVSGGGSSSSAASSSAAAAGGSDAAAAGQDGSSGAASSSGSSAFIVLVALRRLELVVPFSESDIDQIEVGQAATVSVTAVPDEQLAAHVRLIDTLSTTNSGVVSYNATFRLDQSSGAVRPGMTATAKVVVAQADNAVNVSTAAISRRGPFSSVTVVRDGKRVVQRVETGIAGDSTTQILSGLTSGEQVVMRIAVATGGSALQASGAQSSGTLGGQRALLGGGFGGAGRAGGPPGGGP
jgi:multidrug efflux pump subunit AcrA (membrane-fusion protein)